MDRSSRLSVRGLAEVPLPSSHVHLLPMAALSGPEGSRQRCQCIDRVGTAPLIAGKGGGRGRKLNHKWERGSAAQKHTPLETQSRFRLPVFVSMFNLWPGNLALLRSGDKGWCADDGEWDSHNIIKYINITTIHNLLSSWRTPLNSIEQCGGETCYLAPVPMPGITSRINIWWCTLGLY